MALGTNIGTVYRGDQGKELATTFDGNYIKDVINLQASQQKAAAERRAAGAKATAEKAPGETWHFYQNELARNVERALNDGAAIMTATGSDNLWEDSREPAANWRNQMRRLNAAKSNIDQYQKEYDKAVSSIATRELDYDPEYVAAVKNFPKAYGFEDLANGQVQFPVPKFRNPGNLFSGFYVTEGDRYREKLGEGEPADFNEIAQITANYFSDPSKEADANAARQIFQSLDKKDQSYFTDLARRKGLSEPWMAHAAYNMQGMIGTDTVDFTAKATELAKRALLASSESKVKDKAGVTVGSRRKGFASKDYPQQAAKSFFRKNDYLLDKEEEMAQLGISLENTPDREDRRRAAEIALARQIKENEPKETEYSRTYTDGSGISEKEFLTNFDDWRERLNAVNQAVANEAARWLVDTEGFEGQSPIADAQVIQSRIGKILKIQFNNQNAADRARALYLKEQFDPSEIKLTETEENQIVFQNKDIQDGGERAAAIERQTQEALEQKREGYAQYIQDLRSKSEGTTIAVPVDVIQYEQVLKQLHNLSAEQKGALYQTQIKGERPFEIEEPEQSGPLSRIK